MVKQSTLDRWDFSKSAELYLINTWGAPYFSVSEKGEVLVNPTGEKDGVKVSLMEILSGLKQRGMALPALLRFEDILKSRIKTINEAFKNAISSLGYEGDYRGVFPIKVNQQQQVIEDISEFGKSFHHGLEAGSKAELIAAMGYINDSESLLICNGYKDEEFIDLALYSRKIGINTILVVEMPSELDLILERSEKLKIDPVIGIRVRLSTKAGGYWTSSGGDQSMFGLSTAQIMELVDKLKERNKLEILQLLHYHLGSQIPNIRDIRSGIYEACRIYADLKQEGAQMGYLDIGGGLAVDYDGSHTNFGSSCNYTIDEYCVDVVEVVMDICKRANIPHPNIISESGRATVSYYSVLLFNILDVSSYGNCDNPVVVPSKHHELLKNLIEVRDSLTSKNLQECYNDAIYYRDEIRSRFIHGEISLREKAVAEQIFWSIMVRLEKDSQGLKYVPDELKGLADSLADIYYGNFSVFQSLPDIWAIDQLFPIMPIHRLDEFPTRRGTIADITCDCDGKISRFIGQHDVKSSLQLHSLKDGEDYVLGAFLIGAYQETLGDLHNLMGDTNVVSIKLNKDNDIIFTREIEGDSVADVLSYLEYNTKDMVDNMRKKAEQAVLDKRITAAERREILEAYQNGVRGNALGWIPD